MAGLRVQISRDCIAFGGCLGRAFSARMLRSEGAPDEQIVHG